MKTSIQKFDQEILSIRSSGKKPRLLLHACCAPCASSVLDVLVEDFEVTVFFYNPNISPLEEYENRLNEMKRYLSEAHPNVDLIAPVWNEREFLEPIRGLEYEREGGSRCKVCFDVRLTKTKEVAIKNHFDYFATTLTVSPLKNAEVINTIGESLEEDKIKYLVSDFKKRDGYKKSIELSTKYGLYRQNYCGCIFSKKEQ